jgi:hypothetical protein
MSTSKDLTIEPPRSPRSRLGNYILLARAIDKGRASLNSKNGDYHFDCPLDNFLFSFKGVKGADVKQLLADGKSDEEIVKWFDTNGAAKSAEELTVWAAGLEGYLPYNDPEKKDWFVGECEAIGIDPKTNTLFDFLEKDDQLVAAK